mgnify:CR=1 FL=1
MCKGKYFLLIFIIPYFSIFFINQQSYAQEPNKIILSNGWSIASSNNIKEDGNIISTNKYTPQNWYKATMPSTILATLVNNNVYPDPFYSTNIEKIDGYREGIWRTEEMPEGSPFKVPWWFRSEFILPSNFKGEHIWLNLHSINYKADIWLNGKLVADSALIEGTYRLFSLDITDYALPGRQNYLALKIYPPKGMDLSVAWVDWNPTPPDRNTGIWYNIHLTTTGPAKLQHPFIKTNLAKYNYKGVDLEINCEAQNLENKGIKTLLKGTITEVNNLKEGGTSHGGSKKITFEKTISLNAKEKKLVSLTSADLKQLIIKDPKLWWPHLVGNQNLYNLKLELFINGKLSDVKNITFGMREVDSYITENGNRVFKVNGKNILLRGGGYAEDMLLRQSKKRDENDIAYAKFMNLNTLRMEGFRGSDYLYELCDKYGIMLIMGWCCCSPWERWETWDSHTLEIAKKSLTDEVLRLRNHPSIINWLYGSDKFPPAYVEKEYISILNKLDGTRPYQSSATGESSEIAGVTGLFMGPWPEVYSYLSPSKWYSKLEFNTEAGPSGEQIAPLESLKKMMREDELWPMGRAWEIRLHPNFYKDMRNALYTRYGEPKILDEYSLKSQILQLEATKAMFEAFARNKYNASGIIYWMFNSAWPTLYWQLFDYFYTPNGAFYGAKKACEPLHIQYAYDDNSVYLINNFYKSHDNLKVNIKLYDFNMNKKLDYSLKTDINADSVKKIYTINNSAELSEVYFIKLELFDKNNSLLTDNFYWLSENGDDLADFKALMELNPVKLDVSYKIHRDNDAMSLDIVLVNNTKQLAFAVNPKIIDSVNNQLITPIYWDDNYFAMLPNEQKNLKVKFYNDETKYIVPELVINGWNIEELSFNLK